MSTILARYVKQPADREWYPITFAAWLAQRGNPTVEYIQAGADDPGIDIVDYTFANGVASVLVGGGENGKGYVITAQIVTGDNQQKRASIQVGVRGAPGVVSDDANTGMEEVVIDGNED